MYCDCTEDGFCDRYQREMRGRFREICQGVNCDLGTAAAFRMQWERETELIRPATNNSEYSVALILKTDQAPGDAVAMTAAIHSLHRMYPDKFVTAVESPYPEVFEFNPDVVNTESIPGAAEVQMHYPAIHKSNQRGIHFMQGWCEFLGFALGIDIPLLTNRPRLYFPEGQTIIHERRSAPMKDYWVICSGGKKDLTNKLWGHHNYQKVVELLPDTTFIQVGASKDDHLPLVGVTNMVGETSLRDLFDLVRKSCGVMCGVSLLMHVAAALEKPAVVIAGGREPVSWNAYPKQHYIHTIGTLPCSDPLGYIGGACWRSRTVPLGDSEVYDMHPCERPINNTPECMTLITPRVVADIVSMYGRDNKARVRGVH